MNNLIEIKNLSKNYQTINEEISAIKDISFTVNENDFISIVGPSGCGKSTLLKIISNLDKPSNGNIITSKNIKYGYMFQNDTLFDYLTILDNTLLGPKVQNKLNKDIIDKCILLLKKYNLYEFKDKYPKELSGGMRQRVALIRTLMLDPDILLLDEPFSALDPTNRLNISNDVYEIIKKENKTTIMVTHDVLEAVSMSNKVIVLSNRPSTIKNIYIISNKNPKDKRNDKDFYDICNKIWCDLNE